MSQDVKGPKKKYYTGLNELSKSLNAVANSGSLKLFVIGIGPGKGGFLTRKSEHAIGVCDVVAGWTNVFERIDLDVKGKTIFRQDADNYKEILLEVSDTAASSNQNVALLLQDDPTTYSVHRSVAPHFPGFNIELVPAVSSLQLLAAAARISLEESLFVVYEPDPNGNIDQDDLSLKRKRMLRAHDDGYNLIVLSDLEQRLSETAEFLIDNGVSRDIATIVGECVGEDDERVRTLPLSEVATSNFHWMSSMVVRKKQMIDDTTTSFAVGETRLLDCATQLGLISCETPPVCSWV